MMILKGGEQRKSRSLTNRRTRCLAVIVFLFHKDLYNIYYCIVIDCEDLDED